MKILNYEQYIYVPIDLKPEEYEIYRLLYINSKADTLIVQYSLMELVKDSSKIFNFTRRKVEIVIKNLINKGYLVRLDKGTRGNPTKYRINFGGGINNDTLYGM